MKYLLDTDQRLTVKVMKDELEKHKYDVKKNDGYYKLKGYKFKN